MGVLLPLVNEKCDMRDFDFILKEIEKSKEIDIVFCAKI